MPRLKPNPRMLDTHYKSNARLYGAVNVNRCAGGLSITLKNVRSGAAAFIAKSRVRRLVLEKCQADPEIIDVGYFPPIFEPDLPPVFPMTPESTP